MERVSNRAILGGGCVGRGLSGEKKGGGGGKNNKKEAKSTRTQRRSGSQVESFSSCTNHLPKRVMTGVAVLAAAAAAGSLSAERRKQVQSWPSCSSTFGDENDARAPIRDSPSPPRRPLSPGAVPFALHSVLSGLQLRGCNF